MNNRNHKWYGFFFMHVLLFIKEKQVEWSMKEFIEDRRCDTYLYRQNSKIPSILEYYWDSDKEEEDLINIIGFLSYLLTK